MNPIRPFRAERVLKPRDFTPFELPPQPLDLEIGCGVGWHPIRYARENPGRFLVAIERTRARFSAFERRLRAHEPLPNLLPVHADAVAWVTHALPALSLDRVFLLYPNPYPKRSDRGLRWYAMPFMSRLLAALKPQAEILLATNDAAYAEEASGFMTREWGFRLAGERVINGEFPPRTHFEKKYLARGEICRELRFAKGQDPA